MLGGNQVASRARYHQRGQALVELLLIVSSLLTVFLVALPSLSTAVATRHHSIDHFRSVLLQPVMQPGIADRDVQRSLLRATSDYQLARTVAPVLRPLTGLTGLNLPFENLYQTQAVADPKNHTDMPKLAILRDSWSVSSAEHLRADPAALVPTAYMQRVGIQYLQEILSWLPNAREFAPSQLKLGHVDDEVVPEKSLCKGRWLC